MFAHEFEITNSSFTFMFYALL